ncbi:nucleoside deaminase, partial [Salmonella enterica subsp. enterica]
KQGKPFGAVIVKDGQIVATGVNDVLATHDPTAHAEMQAIREASRLLGKTDLSDCHLYASGEPCPMCLGAIYWSQIKDVYYAYSGEEAAEVGL